MSGVRTQNVTARGVRKINEQTVQKGRALIITEEDEDLYSWKDIPNGSLKVNGTTGLIMVKLAGQSSWVPSNVKLDIVRDIQGNILDINGNQVTDPAYLQIIENVISQGGHTLSIAKDATLIRENFTIHSTIAGNGQFSYEDEVGVRYFGKKDSHGYWFELKKGHYAPGRNMLDVIIDDCLFRSAASGGIIEVSETTFIMPEELVDGMELTVKYYQVNRIGNPYPRIYLRKGNYSVNENEYDSLTGMDDISEPEGAEVGDIWIDFNGNPEEADGYLGEVLTVNQDSIPFNRLSGLPATVADAAASGLMSDAVTIDHKHSASDITDLDLKIINAINGITATANATSANTANVANIANDAKLLQGKTVGNAANNIVATQYNGKISDDLISDNVRTISNMVDYEIFMELIESKIQKNFAKGMIMAWYGEAAKVPTGWVICNGQNGTPNLTDKFIMGVGKYSVRSEISAGLPNIIGTFGGNARPGAPEGAFSQVKTAQQGAGTSSQGSVISFNAGSCNNIYGRSDTVQPPAVAMYYIMKT